MSKSTSNAYAQGGYRAFTGVTVGKDIDTQFLQPGWSIKNDGFGLLESSIVFRGDQQNSQNIPAKGEKHIRDERLFCYRVETTKVQGGMLEAKCDFCGIEQEDGMTEIKLSISASSSTDPIETHPNFEKKIGGKPSKPLNGATFIDPATNQVTNDDKKGVFSEFSTYSETTYPPESGLGTQTEKNRFAGVKNFYNPGVSMKGEFFTKNIDTLDKVIGDVGKSSKTGKFGGIILIPEWALTAVASALKPYTVELVGGKLLQRNFLLASASIEQYGNVYKCSYDLTMGGALGWIEEIYPDADSSGSKSTT